MDKKDYNFLLVRLVIDNDGTPDWSLIEVCRYDTFSDWVNAKIAFVNRMPDYRYSYTDKGRLKEKLLNVQHDGKSVTFWHFPQASRDFLMRCYIY